MRRRRHYGAYLAHLGLAVLVLGLAASHFWQQEKDVTLQPGQQVSVAGYTLTYAGVQNRELADHSELVAARHRRGPRPPPPPPPAPPLFAPTRRRPPRPPPP